jgi:hypothetical protein
MQAAVFNEARIMSLWLPALSTLARSQIRAKPPRGAARSIFFAPGLTSSAPASKAQKVCHWQLVGVCSDLLSRGGWHGGSRQKQPSCIQVQR